MTMTIAETEIVHNVIYSANKVLDKLVQHLDEYDFSEYNSLAHDIRRLRSITPPLVIWINSAKEKPTKKGAYKVQSAKCSSAGYRYWNGEYWGNLCSSRAWCLKRKDTGRRSQISLTVYWARYVKP